MRFFYFLRYCAIFIKALVVSNYQVARLVLTPNLRIRPGFVAMPMECDTDFEITSLANSITLTPGTITVHVDQPRQKNHVIVIHCIDVGDNPQAVRDDVRNTLEKNILLWTRKDYNPHAPAGDNGSAGGSA